MTTTITFTIPGFPRYEFSFPVKSKLSLSDITAFEYSEDPEADGEESHQVSADVTTLSEK